jgi:hypothetical protein
MNCEQCKEILVGYIEGLLAESEKQTLDSHLNTCPPCRDELTQLKALHNRLTTGGKVLAQSNLENAVVDRIVRQQSLKLKKVSQVRKQFQLWRIVMRSKITKLAAAAAIFVVAAISITYLGRLTSTAYAIEQTVEANRGLRFIHLKYEPAGNGVEEIWAQFDDKGELLRLRMNFPNTMDGPKDVVWQEDKAEVWFKAKKAIAVLREEKILAKLKMSYENFDPKLIVEQLYHAQANGKGQIEIQESRSKDKPITITSTSKRFRAVYKVDPETKLLQQLEKYVLKDGKHTFLARTIYLDYNKPADPDVFVLSAPTDVVRADQTTQEIGLVQGRLSNEEIAVKVARQFFEALIAEDYDKAGKLLQGLPGNRVQQVFGNKKFLRIISVGSAVPHPNPETQGLVVPCVVEIEEDGKISEWKLDRFGVRQVYNQPGRWAVFGGI